MMSSDIAQESGITAIDFADKDTVALMSATAVGRWAGKIPAVTELGGLKIPSAATAHAITRVMIRALVSPVVRTSDDLTLPTTTEVLDRYLNQSAGIAGHTGRRDRVRNMRRIGKDTTKGLTGHLTMVATTAPDTEPIAAKESPETVIGLIGPAMKSHPGLVMRKPNVGAAQTLSGNAIIAVAVRRAIGDLMSESKRTLTTALLNAYLDASDIVVNVKDCEVTLSGTVADRVDKRVAEDVADSVSGVTNVQDNLRVKEEQVSTACMARGASSSQST